MSRKIDKLQPKVQMALLKAMASMDAAGVKYFIDSTLRTKEEQQAYYAQGRISLSEVNRFREIAGLGAISEKENKYTITNCDGVTNKSAHQSGLAVDIVPMDSRNRPYWPIIGANAWQLIAGPMKAAGFEWGGDWTKFVDCPHYKMV